MVANGEYDLAFSLGQACACSLTLRTADLQLASFPFDWLADGTLPSRVDLLIHRFDHWLEKEDFVYNGRNPINGLGMFRNKKTGLNHLHDFADGVTEIQFDYYDENTDVRYADTARAILSLGISIRDYRTEAERRAYNLNDAMKKYKVRTRFGLFLAKTKDRLFGMFGRTRSMQ